MAGCIRPLVLHVGIKVHIAVIPIEDAAIPLSEGCDVGLKSRLCVPGSSKTLGTRNVVDLNGVVSHVDGRDFVTVPTSWASLRLVGGRGWSSGIGTTSLSLMHRSRPGPDASQLVVEVCRQRGSLNFHEAEIEEWVGLRDDFEGEPIRESEWKAVQIPVASHDFDFEMIRGEDERWGALSSQGDLVVKIEANHFSIEDST
jgi:hypothetical protein